jgi:hypothetical protein
MFHSRKTRRDEIEVKKNKRMNEERFSKDADS